MNLQSTATNVTIGLDLMLNTVMSCFSIFYDNIFYLAFEKCTGKILALRDGNAKFVDVLTKTGDQKSALILDQTCFYAEQGGQIYDTGVLTKVGDAVLAAY